MRPKNNRETARALVIYFSFLQRNLVVLLKAIYSTISQGVKNEVRANFLATQLDHANKKRQIDQEKATEDAINFVLNNYDVENVNILVVWSESWHAGLIGLIAGKIAEKFNKSGKRTQIRKAKDPK